MQNVGVVPRANLERVDDPDDSRERQQLAEQEH